MVDGSVRIADEVRSRIVGQPPIRPIVNAIGRCQMERLALTPAIDHDMIHTPAIPDHRIFQVTCWEAGHIRIYAAPLKLVRAQDAVRADHNRAGPRHDLKAAVRANHRSEEHTSELQSRQYLVCRLLLE